MLPISAGQARHFPGTGEVGTARVRVRRIDEVLIQKDIFRPSLLKVDVQGFEAEVLRGAEGILPCIDEALVECSFEPLYDGQTLADRVIRWLDERGLVLRGIYSPSYGRDGRSLQADFHFLRESG